MEMCQTLTVHTMTLLLLDMVDSFDTTWACAVCPEAPYTRKERLTVFEVTPLMFMLDTLWLMIGPTWEQDHRG